MKLLLAALLGAAISAGAVGATISNHRYVQTIYVRNLSGVVTDTEIENDLPAFQAATSKDFAPSWHVDAKLVFIGAAKAPAGSAYITLLDDSDTPGALAYHTVKSGVPISRVFVGTCKQYNASWTNAFTHEEWEMLADPSTLAALQAPDGRMFAEEVADPVEDDSLSYTRQGADGKPVLISDFVTLRWFGAALSGPYDFARHITAPLEVLKGGYEQYWDGYTWVLVEK